MKLLLDTQSFLWFIGGSPRLSPRAASRIADPANEVVLSIASLWEMAVKVSLGKLNLGEPFGQLIPAQLQTNRIGVLPIEVAHLAIVSILPLHHHDPFDRLIIAQAEVEGLPIVSSDPAFDAYPVTRLW
jgi:PIN domain nuclease of toxin-antitoxin system